MSLAQKTIRMLRDAGPSATVSRIAWRLALFAETTAAAAKLRLHARRYDGIEESLDFAFGFSVGEVSIEPAQIRSEIQDLLVFLTDDPPSGVLEIGTARGGTLFLLSRVARADAVLVSVDLPRGTFGGGYRREATLLLKALRRERQTLELLRADSHRSTTFAEVRHRFENQPLDFLLIDGDHTYEGVRSDFNAYGGLVRPGGIIALHDIVPGPSETVGGVPSFWQEIKSCHVTREFVADWNQGGYGIGVVEVGRG